MNNIQENNSNNIKATEQPLRNEPLTMGIIIRGLPQEIQVLLEYLEENQLKIIYKTMSYGKLFIIPEKVE